MNTNSPNQIESFNDESHQISLNELFLIIWSNKIILLIFILVFFIFGITYAKYLPNIYRSDALLIPVDQKDGLMGSSTNLSGLASIAGINISNNSSSKSKQALEALSSRQFFKEKILPNIYLPDLMADPRWNQETNKLVYDRSLFDSKTEKWVRKFTFPYQQVPSVQEAHDLFLKDILTISTNKATGFTNLSISHVSPYVAKSWATIVIDEINNQFRIQDQEIAIASISYLNNLIASTSVVEVRQTLSELLQKQIQTSMLTNASKDYVFKVLDPPIVPEKKDSPSRSLIVLMSIIFGSVLGILSILIKSIFKKQT